VHRELDEIIATLAGLHGQPRAVDDPTLVGAVHRMVAMRATLDALWLETVNEVERRGLATRAGARDTATWLAGIAGERVGSARRDVKLGSTLAGAPVVGEAMASGAVSKTKATALADAAVLPEDVQRALVRDAVEGTVAQVTNAVRRARLTHGHSDPPVEPSCTLTRHRDHVKLEATVDLVDGEHLEVAIDAMAEALKLPTDLPYPQRRAAALVALARFYLDHAADPPDTRVGRPHVLVLVDLDTLLADTGGTATLGSGTVISGAQARQLAMDANITRVVTRGRSEILDVGRATRNPSPAQAKAVIVRDRHCRYADCDSPPWACEIHHRQPWNNGGATDLDNLGLLCWHHHKLIHRRGPHLLTDNADGRWVLPPPDQQRTAAA
jgi:hypothetical protein